MIQKSKKAKLELKERRNVTSRYHGSKISGIRSNDDGDGNENGKIAQGFLIYQQNNKIPRSSRFFVHILAVDCDMKLPNFMCPLYGLGEQHTNIFFLLKGLNLSLFLVTVLYNGPSGFNPR